MFDNIYSLTALRKTCKDMCYYYLW